MRDLLVFTILLGGIPFYFLNPFNGVLVYHLVSIMNPHRYTYGAAYSFSFASYIAAATLFGLILGQGERNPLPKEKEVFLLVALWMLFLISAIYSLDPNM